MASKNLSQLVNESVMQVFSKIEINGIFYERCKNFGFAQDHYGPMQEKTYKKISKSKAIVISQIGYGNTRDVGNTFTFAPFKPVTII